MSSRNKYFLSMADCEKLIREVRKRPVIWNGGHNNRFKYLQSWNEVAKLLETDVNKCRMKWRNLRDTFKNKARGLRSLQDYRGTWAFFKQMSFVNSSNRKSLKKPESPRQVVLETREQTDDSSDFGLENGTGTSGIQVDEHGPVVGSEASENDPAEELAIDFIKAEQYQGGMTDQEFESVDVPASTSDTRPRGGARSTHADYEDYDLLFLRSLVPFFRELRPLGKLRVRRKVEELLMMELEEQAAGGDADDAHD